MNYLNVSALIPIYDSNGTNCTRLILTNGTEVLEHMPIAKLLEKMHVHSRMSYQSNVEWASMYLLGKGTRPLLFDESHVFLRCQIRSDLTKGDGCYGYISLFDICKFEGATVFLNNDTEIVTCATPSQLANAFHQASLLLSVHLSTTGPNPQIPAHTHNLLKSLNGSLLKKSAKRS